MTAHEEVVKGQAPDRVGATAPVNPFEGGWALSPSQLSFYALLEAMRANMEAANAYAKGQETIWDPSNNNSMYDLFMKEYNSTIAAGAAQADATRFQAGESIINAGMAVVSAGGSFLPGGKEYNEADSEVKNAENTQSQLKGMLADRTNPRAMLGGGDEGFEMQPRRFGYDELGEQDQAVLDRMDAESFRKCPEGLDTHPDGGARSYREVLETCTNKEISERLESVNDELDEAYKRRNAAENDRQRKSQLINALSQIGQGAGGATMRFEQANKQNEQANEQAAAAAGKMGQTIYQAITKTDDDAQRSSYSSAGGVLQIIAGMERPA